MVKFTVYLSDDDFVELYELKDHTGHGNMTGEEYATELLKNAIKQKRKDTNNDS